MTSDSTNAGARPGYDDGHLALAQIAGELARASLNPAAVLEVLVSRSAEMFGDLCLARLVTDDGQRLRNRVWAHADPAVAPLLDGLLGERDQPVGDAAVGEVLRTAEPRILLQATSVNWSAAVADYLSARGIASAVLAPLRSRGRVLGVVHLSRDRGRPPYTMQDCELFLDLVERAGLMYDNARLYREVEHRGVILDQIEAAVVSIDIARDDHDLEPCCGTPVRPSSRGRGRPSGFRTPLGPGARAATRSSAAGGLRVRLGGGVADGPRGRDHLPGLDPGGCVP